MIFASDNWAGAHPKVTAALAAHGSGFATAYGDSDLDKAVALKFNEIFEREVAVFFVGTGTAANALSLTACQQTGRRRLLLSRGACDRGRMRRARIFHRRRAPVPGRRPGGTHRSGQPRARHRPLSGRVRAFRPADLRVDHPIDRDRHGLWPRRNRCDRRDLPQGPPAAAHGRRAFRQCAGLARRDAGRNDLEARRRRAVLRRHQERLLVRRGDRAVRSRPGGRNGLHPQARRAALFQVAIHRRAIPCLFRRRAVAGNRPPRQFAGRQACRPHPRHPGRCGSPGSPRPTRSSRS